jgi:hypothetical protein
MNETIAVPGQKHDFSQIRAELYQGSTSKRIFPLIELFDVLVGTYNFVAGVYHPGLFRVNSILLSILLAREGRTGFTRDDTTGNRS